MNSLVRLSLVASHNGSDVPAAVSTGDTVDPDDVSQPLQRDGDQQPGRLGLAENEAKWLASASCRTPTTSAPSMAAPNSRDSQISGLACSAGRKSRTHRACHAPLLEPTLSIIGPAGEPDIDTDQAPRGALQQG